MSVEVLRPDATISSTDWTIGGGAGSHHAAQSDNSDATYSRHPGDPGDSPPLHLGFDEPSPPAGSVPHSMVLFLRCRKESKTVVLAGTLDNVKAFENVNVTWSSPTTIAVVSTPRVGFPSSGVLYAVRNKSVGGGIISTSGAVRIHEAYVWALSVDQPVVSAEGPTGTLTDQTRPTVEWSSTLDSLGGGQTFYEVKIFDSATYGGGGFDPDTSTPIDSIAITGGSEESWQGEVTLPDDDYRAYVRVAQTVNGAKHWSEWDYSAFTVAVDRPADPTLTLVADSDLARIAVLLQDNSGDATTDLFEVQRSDDGGTSWGPVRTSRADGLIDNLGGEGGTLDYEAPNGTTVTYRARALHDYSGLYAASEWVEDSDSWASSGWWLKHPTIPNLNLTAIIRSQADRTRSSNRGILRPLGAQYPVVVSDTRGPDSGTLVLLRESLEEREALDELLDAATPLLLQGPPADGIRDRWVSIGDQQTTRIADKSFSVYHDETLPWTAVDRPSDAQLDFLGLFPAEDLFPDDELFPE